MALFRRRQLLLLDSQATYQSTVLGIAPASLLAYWPLTETGGTQATDVSGNARHGTYSGVTLAQIAGPGASMGLAGLWDGVNDTCNVFSASLDGAFNKNLHTIAGWAKVVGAGSWSDTTNRLAVEFSVAAGATTGNTGAFKSSDVNSFRLQAWGEAVGGNPAVATSTTAWFHLAIVINGASAIPYFNAAAATTITPRGAWANPFSTAALGSRGGTSFFWSGYLAHFAVWSAALSAEQIQMVATAR